MRSPTAPPAYNRAMRALHPLLLLALATAPAFAQNTSQNATKGNTVEREQLSKQEQKATRQDQRTERIRVEDGGSRVDELRVGGQTQSINVQPKGSDMPAYEVKSPDAARSRSGSNSGAETNTAPRVWNVMKFCTRAGACAHAALLAPGPPLALACPFSPAPAFPPLR